MNISSGDIVYAKRNGYRHFGIYAGQERVIHYYKECNPLLCDGIIAETSVAEFLSGSDTLYVLNGPGPSARHDLFDNRYGFTANNYIGQTKQVNTRDSSWIEFFRTSRLAVQFDLAAHYLDKDDRRCISVTMKWI